MSTPNDPQSWIPAELDQLQARGLRRTLITRSGNQAAVTQVGGKRLVNLSANDYLGLASHPRLVEAAKQATAEHGWGSGASPLVTGRSSWHEQLEHRLAEFEGAEAALLFPTGFAANAGVIPALVGEGDAIFADAKNHASIIDGCRLSHAEKFIYPHNDTKALETFLHESRHARKLIVTDTLFSMDGDLAPLDRLAELSIEHHAMLLVDEAHATGVWGELGRGAAEHFASDCPALEQASLIRLGTLSKALGSVGGFVVGSADLIDWLANRARSYVFSTAAPAAAAAAGAAALDLVEQEPHRRRELLAKADLLRQLLQDSQWNTGSSVSQIVPLLIGDPEQTMRIARGLQDAGFLAPGIRPPSVPQGESLLRVSLCHGHQEEDLHQFVAALNTLRR